MGWIMPDCAAGDQKARRGRVFDLSLRARVPAMRGTLALSRKKPYKAAAPAPSWRRQFDL